MSQNNQSDDIYAVRLLLGLFFLFFLMFGGWNAFIDGVIRVVEAIKK